MLAKFQAQRGVSMVELTVVLAVFMILLGIILSIFLAMAQQQKNTLHDEELLNETSYALSYISRMAMAAVTDTSGSCLGLSNAGKVYQVNHLTNLAKPVGQYYQGITFLTSAGVCESFFIDTDGQLKESKNGAAAQAMISSAFPITYAIVMLDGDKTLQTASSSDAQQPRVTVSLDLAAQSSFSQPERVFQITASQRKLSAP